MATGPSHSPSSSPRLPSPPPMAEDQTGPQSPTPGSGEDIGRLGLAQSVDDGASRRIRPGTKAEEMHEGPPMTDLADIDSAFQLTEHLKALYQNYTHPPSQPDIVAPMTRESATILATPPQGTDRALWLYELCRFLVQKSNIIITALFADSPPCSAATCPEMRASEWQYLCAVHDPPKSCCAIDYCCHTLDWAANTLTSQKYFPSRLRLSDGSSADARGNNPQNHPIRQLTNIFRRVYRIFAHAWFQHREVFWRVEARTGFYVLFKTVCDAYSLIPDDNYTIPPEAEGVEPSEEILEQSGTKPPHILTRESAEDEPVTSIPRQESSGQNSPPTPAAAVGASVGSQSLTLPPSNNGITSQTARRLHRASPSKGSNVATVPEENEEIDEHAFPQPLTARLTEQGGSAIMESQMAEALPRDGTLDADLESSRLSDSVSAEHDDPSKPGDLAEHLSHIPTTPEETGSPGANLGDSAIPVTASSNDAAKISETRNTGTVSSSSSSGADDQPEEQAVVKEEEDDKDRPIVSTGVASAEIPQKSEGE